MEPVGAPAPAEAVIFDLDGVLVDSEPIWRAVEIEVFAGVGVELTDDLCRTTMGLRVNEVTDHWFRRRPWNGPEPAEVARRIVAGVVAAIEARGRAMPGVEHAVGLCRRRGLRLAVASSSDEVVIRAALRRLGLEAEFAAVRSAQHERRGKPHPGVYLSTAAALGVAPARCVAVEDSLHGVRAAKAAGMVCVAVPDPGGDPGAFAEADHVLGSLAELETRHLA
ncbi:MAG: hexitol phosphatase HxpB [Acidimicrobiia bacterium]|nr:hexitol phosphatase HxpB [Acidimicrobiia bacterium]